MTRITHRIAQLTDVHVIGAGLVYGAVDTFANLERALARIEQSPRPVDAILLTGDIADRGEPAAYARVRAAVDEAAQRLGVPPIYGIGNHDERRAFRVGMLDGPASDDPIDYVVDVQGLRIVMLDSTVIGSDHGEVTDAQLHWLAGVLAEPAPLGTVLTIHHPPFARDVDPARASDFGDIDMSGIGDTTALAGVVRGSDVRIVVSGHLHEAKGGQIGGVPIWAGASSATTHSFTDGMFRVRPASGMTFIDLFDDGTATASAIELEPPAPVLELTMEQLRAFMTQLHA